MNQFMTAVVQYLEDNKTKIAFGMGGLLTVAGTVYSCKQTLNVPKIMEAHKKRLMNVETGIEFIEETSETKKLSEKDKKAAKFRCYAKTTWEFIKNYGISVSVEAAGIAMMGYSNVTLENQKAALAIMATNGAVKCEQLVKFIRDNYGEEAATMAQYGLEKEVVKGKKGEEDTVTYTFPEEYSEYSVFLERADEEKQLQNKELHDLDDGFLLNEILSVQQNVASRLRDSWDKTVSLSEVYSMLRTRPLPLDIQKASRVMGYRFNPRTDEVNELGLPKKFVIKVMTTWPQAELVPVEDLIAERARFIAEEKPWNRLDKSAVLTDLPKPEVIV